MNLSNQEWSDKIICKIDPNFKHRWEIYKDVLKNFLDLNKTWIDCGCGDNSLVKDLAHLARNAFGVDIVGTNKVSPNYVKADIRNMPFSAGCVDLVTLRFVVEHFKNPEGYFGEIKRVLKTNGKILIITTNLISPVIFIPKFIFPYFIKNQILSKVFKVESKDIYPAYHRINSPQKYKKLNNGLRLLNVKFISDLNYTRKLVFLFLLAYHMCTKIMRLENLRTNLLVILEKE